MWNLSAILVILLLTDALQHNKSITACSPPYHQVGVSCLMIDNIVTGNWTEMKDLCNAIGGDLVNLADANILYDISNYLKDQGMDDVSYWVGTSDQQTEGTWTWSSDNSAVKMGVPLWGHLYGLQPDGGIDNNCGVLQRTDFYYLHDDSCDSMYGVICQPGNADEARRSSLVLPPNECPTDYDIVGNTCLRIYVEENYTWTESSKLCSGPNSHLAQIDDANFLGELFDYLQQLTDVNEVWIGGSDEVVEDQWLWEDKTSIKRGTPFWDVNEEGNQEPAEGTASNYLFLRKSDLFLFRDAPMSNKNGAICQHAMT